MTLTRSLVVCAVLGISAVGCGSAPPRQPVASVPLEVPEPPPRANLEPASTTAEGAPAERPARPATATTEPAGGRQGRPPSPAPPAPVPPAATPQGTVPAASTPELRPGGTAGQTRSVQELREIIARTSQKLARLDRARLSAGQQADFDTASRFLAQAEQGIRVNNLMLAQYSAEKAETLINGLR